MKDIAVYFRVKRALFVEGVEHLYVVFLDTFPEVKKWWFWLINLILLGGIAYGGWWAWHEYYNRQSPEWAARQLQKRQYGIAPEDLIRAIRDPKGAELWPLFAQARVDVNAAAADGTRPLWAAVDAENYEMTMRLLALDAEVNLRGANGTSLLEFAAEKGNAPIFNLIFARADPDTLVGFNQLMRFADTALLKKMIEKRYPRQANEEGRWKVPDDLILENDFLRHNIRQRDAEGMEPIHWAAARGDPGIIDLLIDERASPNALESKYQQTPLIIAAIAGNEAAVQRLIFHQADMNIRDAEGKSALFYAIVRNHPAVVSQLLKSGADPDVRESKGGITAASIAAYMNRPTILAALIDAGADVTKQDFQGLAALDWAAYGGNMETIEVLWDKSSVLYSSNKRLVQSALRIARDSGNTQVIEYLERLAR